MLEDGGDVPLSARAGTAFGDIENYIRPGFLKGLVGIAAGIDRDNFVALRQSAVNGGYGLRSVPFRLAVRRETARRFQPLLRLAPLHIKS
jgi:hypothetical protein